LPPKTKAEDGRKKRGSKIPWKFTGERTCLSKEKRIKRERLSQAMRKPWRSWERKKEIGKVVQAGYPKKQAPPAWWKNGKGDFREKGKLWVQKDGRDRDKGKGSDKSY